MKSSKINPLTKLAVIAASAFVSSFSAQAASVYIGDSASQGLAVTQGSTLDTATPVVYAFVSTTNQAAVYTAPADQLIRLTEVNFYKKATTSTANLTPFVAIYSGSLTTPSSIKTGANYNVVAKGDVISYSGTNSASLQNLSFTIGGVNPEIFLQAGDVLVAGFLNADTAGIVTYDNVSQSQIDYIGLGNYLPVGATGPLTGDNSAGVNLNRAQKFNIGFDVIPEPSTFLLSLTSIGAIALGRRRH